jgi:hypothetical protein
MKHFWFDTNDFFLRIHHMKFAFVRVRHFLHQCKIFIWFCDKLLSFCHLCILIHECFYLWSQKHQDFQYVLNNQSHAIFIQIWRKHLQKHCSLWKWSWKINESWHVILWQMHISWFKNDEAYDFHSKSRYWIFSLICSHIFFCHSFSVSSQQLYWRFDLQRCHTSIEQLFWMSFCHWCWKCW